MSSLYKCYSVPLMKFLLESGFRYDLVGKNPRNNKTFWVFIKDERLSASLDKWTANKK